MWTRAAPALLHSVFVFSYVYVSTTYLYINVIAMLSPTHQMKNRFSLKEAVNCYVVFFCHVVLTSSLEFSSG